MKINKDVKAMRQALDEADQFSIEIRSARGINPVHPTMDHVIFVSTNKDANFPVIRSRLAELFSSLKT